MMVLITIKERILSSSFSLLTSILVTIKTNQNIRIFNNYLKYVLSKQKEITKIFCRTFVMK